MTSPDPNVDAIRRVGTFIQAISTLRQAARRHPNCRIANCDCDSKHGQWRQGCHCMCHFKAMDAKYGQDRWDLYDFGREAISSDRDPCLPAGEAPAET